MTEFLVYSALDFQVYADTAKPAEYTLLIRDARTLELLGEVPAYTAMSWRRRGLEAGEFQLNLHRSVIAPELITRNRIIEVRRNGAYEFAGIIRRRRYDAIERTWELAGPDLQGFWLSRRQILPPAGESHDSVASVPAEHAMTGYVERHLTAPLDTGRSVNGELDGITFDVAPSEARGNLVTFNGRYANLLTGCLQQLGTTGGLLHEVVFQYGYAGYRYQISEPVDATVSTGDLPVILSVGWDTAGQLEYLEDAGSLVNAVYVLGQGEGDARTVRLVEDAASITSDFRAETAADSRNNASNAALDQDGAIVLSRSLAALEQVTAQPLIVGAARYRADWDLGYDVTVAIPEIGVEVDRRIVEVSVTLDANQGEEITVQLGALQRTQARIVSEALQRNNRVMVE